jgi:hypothetical protein
MMRRPGASDPAHGQGTWHSACRKVPSLPREAMPEAARYTLVVRARGERHHPRPWGDLPRKPLGNSQSSRLRGVPGGRDLSVLLTRVYVPSGDFAEPAYAARTSHRAAVMKCKSMASSCAQRAGDCGDNDQLSCAARAQRRERRQTEGARRRADSIPKETAESRLDARKKALVRRLFVRVIP